MFQVAQKVTGKGEILIPGSPISRFLFRNTAASWLWLAIRLWVGWK